MVLETERLLLRELTMDDFDDLHAILSDPESMKHYPSPFSPERTTRWVQWNIDNYATYGFGLWAVVCKEDGRMIGDCGITMQNINGAMQPEVGFHINKRYGCKGYATEAATAVAKYAFEHLRLPELYCYQKYTNLPSQRVAEKLGMKRVMEYDDPKNTVTTLYRITTDEFRQLAK